MWAAAFWHEAPEAAQNADTNIADAKGTPNGVENCPEDVVTNPLVVRLSGCERGSRSGPNNGINGLRDASKEIKYVNRSRIEIDEDPMAARRVGGNRPGGSNAGGRGTGL